jgi:NIMA (never in mitosis gene a)-related kinase
MELADEGDTYKFIVNSHERKVYVKEKFVWKVFIQIVKGLRVLHQHKILHRDMKNANFFLFKCGQAKLGDLNVSKIAKQGMLQT